MSDNQNTQSTVYDPNPEKSLAQKMYPYAGAILLGLIESIQVNTFVVKKSTELTIPFVIMVVIGILIGLIGLQMAKMIYSSGKKKEDFYKSSVARMSDNVVLVILSGLFSLVALLVLNSIYFATVNAI